MLALYSKHWLNNKWRTMNIENRIYGFSAIGMALLLSFSSLRAQSPDYLFTSGAEGYHTFRIPAIVTTTGGVVLAFAEGRKKSTSDTGDIDLVMKRSEDGGISWSPLKVLWDDEENTCGNPAPVVDRTTGRVYLLTTRNLGKDREAEIIDQTSDDTRRIYILQSNDEGLSWSEPHEITPSVKQSNWTWYATGPGHGIQIRNGSHEGRLVIPCDHIEAETKKYYSHIIYSNDHGKTWELGGTTPQDMVNECAVAEMPGGNLMLNMRNYDRSSKSRKVALSRDGGITWSNIYSDDTLIEPICQASLFRYSFTEEGKSRLLFLNPASEKKREKMTLRVSYDEGATWPVSMVLHEGPSAYSDITVLSTGEIACLYERGMDNPYEGIVFQKIKIHELEDKAAED